MKFRYTAEDDPEGFEWARNYESTRERITIYDECSLVEEIVAHYYDKHDGYEQLWPCDFTVWHEDGKLIGVFHVEREFYPVFSASDKNKWSDKK